MFLKALVNEENRRINFDPTSHGYIAGVVGDFNVDGITFYLPDNTDYFAFSDAIVYVIFFDSNHVSHKRLLNQRDTYSGMPKWTFDNQVLDNDKTSQIVFFLELVITNSSGTVLNSWISAKASVLIHKHQDYDNQEEQAAMDTEIDRLAGLVTELTSKAASIGDVERLLETITGSSPQVVATVSDLATADPTKLYLVAADGRIYYYLNNQWNPGPVYGSYSLDSTLAQTGQAADAKATGDRISAVEEDLEDVKEDLSTKTGLSEEVKQALLACFDNVVWVGTDGQGYIDALEDALYPPTNLVNISAVYTQSGTVYDTDSLDILKPDLVVTAHYSDGTSGIVTGYTLSGTLAEGTSTVTVSYGLETATFNVTVTHKEVLVPTEYQQVEYIEGTGNQYIETSVITANSYLKMTVKYFKATQATKNEDLFYGLTQTTGQTNGFEVGFSTTANRLYAYSKTSAEIIDGRIYNSMCDLEAVFKPSSPYAALKIASNGTTLTGEKTSANASNFNDKIVCILGCIAYGVNLCASARLYSANLYNANDELLFEGIPCYRKSDGVIGMYDRVSNTFFTNAGTGTFLKGVDI